MREEEEAILFFPIQRLRGGSWVEEQGCFCFWADLGFVKQYPLEGRNPDVFIGALSQMTFRTN
jgi:hypothetical protein